MVLGTRIVCFDWCPYGSMQLPISKLGCFVVGIGFSCTSLCLHYLVVSCLNLHLADYWWHYSSLRIVIPLRWPCSVCNISPKLFKSVSFEWLPVFVVMFLVFAGALRFYELDGGF